MHKVLGILTKIFGLTFKFLIPSSFKMKKKTILVLFSIILCAPLCFGQKFLALDKRGKIKRIKFYTGSYISFKTKDNLEYEGKIGFLKDSSFILNNQEIMLSKIKSIYIEDNHSGLSLLSDITYVAGLGYFLIDTTNGLINDENPVVLEETARVSAIFLSISLGSRLFASRTFKINNKHPVKILDLSID